MKALPLLFCLSIASVAEANAQIATSLTPIAASAPTLVPALVPYSGVAVAADGKPVVGEASATFLLFTDEHGGEPIWVESQTLMVDPTGHYQVKLGATASNGLPLETFASGEVRWLEVQIAGQTTGPRVLLTSVPYALKAADAATLGGLPASAFVLASSIPGASAMGSNAITPDAASNVTTTGGTNFYVPRFNTASTIINSEIYDNGTSVGIGGVPNPQAKLDVNGAMIMRGKMIVSRTGNATASTGYPSYGFQFFSNAYNSSTGTGDNPFFSLQSEPTGNNTASPSATFNLLFSNNGGAAAETGFSINPDGTINFANNQTFSGYSNNGGPGLYGSSSYGTGVSGTSQSGDGVYGSTSGNTNGTAGVYGKSGPGSGQTGTAGLWGDSYYGIGVLGTSYTSVGTRGLSYSGVGAAGSSTTSDGMLGYTSGNTDNTAGVLGQASGVSGLTGIAGVWGDSTSHVGVYATSIQAEGLLGISVQGSGVYGVSNDTNGNDDVAGVYGYASGALPAIKGNNVGRSGPAATFLNGSSSVPAVIGTTYGGGPNASAVGVYGDAAASSGIGVEGNTLSGIGVYATTNAQSTGFQLTNFVGPIALWADSTPPNGDGSGIAVRATANGNNAGYFTNNSQDSTIYSYNYGSGGSGTNVFRNFEAAGPNGVCGFGGNGDMTCTGQVKSLATTANGARTVETYSVQSPENWMEDFGSGTLHGGVATVSIDADFAETVTGNADYHVFLTPRGDSKGLYITNTTATSFEVRESGGGTSTLGFDYRIVAKRRGFETQRMVDVTEAMKAVKTKNDLEAERFKSAAKNDRAAR